MFSGIISVEEWNGKFITALKYQKGKITNYLGAPENGVSQTRTNTLKGVNYVFCYTVDYYHYSYVINSIKTNDCCFLDYSETYCTLVPQEGGSNSGIDYGNAGAVGGGSSGGGSSGCQVPADQSLKGAKKVNAGCPPIVTDQDLLNAEPLEVDLPKIDLNAYRLCFADGNAASGYKLTLYIEQPEAGTDSQYLFTGQGANTSSSMGQIFVLPQGVGINVGHTFVGFEKDESNGTAITQVLGFYPSNGGPMALGGVKDDSGHPYNVKYTISVTEAQFNAAYSKATTDANSAIYTLTSYNCSDAALSWMNLGGAAINKVSKGIFTNTPGDLGQYLSNSRGASTGPHVAPTSHGPCN